MRDYSLYEDITAFVDNELDDNRKNELKQLIDSDSELQHELHIQQSIKTLLKERFTDTKAPLSLYNSVITHIRNENL